MPIGFFRLNEVKWSVYEADTLGSFPRVHLKAGRSLTSPEIGDISSPLRNVSGISYYRQFNMAAVEVKRKSNFLFS